MRKSVSPRAEAIADAIDANTISYGDPPAQLKRDSVIQILIEVGDDAEAEIKRRGGPSAEATKEERATYDCLVAAVAKRDLFLADERANAVDAPRSGKTVLKAKLPDGAAEVEFVSVLVISPALLPPYDVEAMNEEFALVMLGKDHAILWERPSQNNNEGMRFLTVQSFKVLSRNATETYVDDRGRKKSISFADKWLDDPKRRTYAGIEFFPTTTAETGTAGFLNLWKGFAVSPSENGTCHIFHDHLKTNVCGGDDALYRWLFGWFAAIFQRPRSKAGTSVIFRGGMGAGKTIIGQVIGSLFPAHYVLADDPRYVTGNFNAHMLSCMFLQADEAVWAGDKAAEGRLRGLITSTRQMVELKGVDPYPVANHVRLCMTSNSDWIVPAGKDERRFAVFDVGNLVQQNRDYFREMFEELDAGGYGRLLHDLMTFDLSTVDVSKIPLTDALLEQKIHSFDPIEAYIHDRLMAGIITRQRQIWPEWIATKEWREDFLFHADEVKIHRRGSAEQFSAKLKKLLPSLARSLRRIKGEDGEDGGRVWGYELPPLQVVRDEFSAAVRQQIPWLAE